MNLAGVGNVQIGVQDPIGDSTLLTRITAPARRGDVKLQVRLKIKSEFSFRSGATFIFSLPSHLGGLHVRFETEPVDHNHCG